MNEAAAETSNRIIEVEPGAIAIRPSNMAIGQALGVDEIIAQVRLIQEVMGKVMQEGEHYGKIPGCGDKKTLLQPGAQKLTMTFRLAPEYQIQEADLTRGHKEYRVICTLKSIQSGTFVGQGVGCCSTMESKYRWRSAARRCPECGKETIIKGKAEYGGGWLCFGKKGGCGFKWPDGTTEIESQSEEKVENDNPADHFNTVLKMAKKRAFVDATITATAASDIFTQDIGDAEGDDAPPPPPPPPKPTPKPKGTQANGSQGNPGKHATEKTRAWFLTELRKRFDDETLKRFYQLATLETIPLESVPTSKPKLEEIAARILATVKTGKATPQSELADLITTAGFTFDLFQNLVIGLGALKQACGSFDELPEERAKWCLRNSKAILSGLIKSAPKEKPAEKSTDSDWSSFPMPWGKQAGTPLGELDEKYLYGLWANYEVETEYNGRPKKKETIEKDREFRAMLDHAGVHHEFEDRGFEKQD